MKTTQIGVLSVTLGLLTLAPSAKADTLLEKIAATVLADQFGIDTRDVIVMRDRSGGSIYDLSPYYEMSYYGRSSPSSIWALRNQGLGWGQVAQRIGMHPGTFNKLRKNGAFDRDRFWTDRYRTRFGVTDQQITVLRRSGGSLEDILGAIVIGKLTRQSPQLIYDRYRTDRSWSTVSTYYKAPLKDWRRVVVPVKTVYRLPSKSNSGVRDRGEGVGKGKSQGASHGKGHGVAKGGPPSGHGLGNSKSKGQGNGGGNGNGNGNGKGKGGGNGHGKGHGKGG